MKHSTRVSVEFRPRLGIAQAFVSGPVCANRGPAGTSSVGVVDGNFITLPDGSLIRWPMELGRPVMCSGISQDDDGLTFRIQIQCPDSRNDVSVLINPDSRRSSISLPVPCLVGPTSRFLGAEAHVLCRACGSVISCPEFRVHRILPLPSADWNDFSPDWFCGCCHSHNHDATSNRSLSVAPVMPDRSGDILHSAAFVYLKSSDLSATRITADGVQCDSCRALLGFHKSGHVQLWHNSAMISLVACSASLPTKADCLAEDTFRRVLIGALNESNWNPIKLYLVAADVSDASVLLWIMEPHLCLLTSSSDESEGGQLRVESHAVKVLFQQNAKVGCQDDARLVISQKVPWCVAEAGLQLLGRGSLRLHPAQRRHMGWSIAIILL